MERHFLAEAVGFLHKANDALNPNRCDDAEARALLARYAEAKKLASFGEAALAARLADPGHVARVTGTSVRRARETLETAEQAEKTPELGQAMRAGEVSLEQAAEIAKTERVAPGSAGALLERARGGAPLQVLRDEGRRRRLEVQPSEGLAGRQREARFLSHGITDDGMFRLEGEFEPEVGSRLVNRLEAEARRLARAAHHEEPFRRYLADALPNLMAGNDKAKGGTELVVLVSHGVAARGWKDVRDGEFCKIPGVGPVDPETARRIADDAFLSGVFFDGEDLRNIKRWTRHIPAAVKVSLNLGDPPGFDGPRCDDCGNRHGLEWDHDDPKANGGETSLDNLKPRYWRCHQKKTRRDREAGRLKPARAGPR
ncbi:MAG: HNH endonuclease signature motif containing protein [Acidimicrobiia bacterium]